MHILRQSEVEKKTVLRADNDILLLLLLSTPGWRDVVKKEDRVCTEGLAQLDKLFSEVRTGRPDIKALQETSAGERRKKTTIKQLFTAASKFQKHLRR